MKTLNDNIIPNNGRFAEGLSFYKVFWCFLIGSIFGTYYEEIITFFRHGVWENRSSVIIGPFNPLYGTAFILALLLFNKMKNPIKIILLGALFGGAFEYAANWAQEFFTGSVSWDYSKLLLNINGRTTVIFSLFWGCLIYVFVKIIYPYLSIAIEKIPVKFGKNLSNFLIIFISLNMFITYSMLIRQGERAKGNAPKTIVGEIYDDVFTDEYISELFPNMVLQEEETDD